MLDGFCCQSKKDPFAVAFILPDAMTLGFSTYKNPVGLLEKYTAAAAEHLFLYPGAALDRQPFIPTPRISFLVVVIVIF